MVRDDGKGFDLDEVKVRRSSALRLPAGMENAPPSWRTVQVHSRPGYGTEVEARIPYHVASIEVKDEYTPAPGG